MLCQRKLPDAQIFTCIRNNPFSRRKWRPQTHSSRLKQILLHLISKACCICISRPQYQLYGYTNSTINIRKLYRTCYDSATAYDSSAASCRISSQISPMSLITLSSLLGDNINHWMNLYPISFTFHDALGWLYHNPCLLYVIQSYRFAVEQSISCCKLHDSIDKASWAYQL